MAVSPCKLLGATVTVALSLAVAPAQQNSQKPEAPAAHDPAPEIRQPDPRPSPTYAFGAGDIVMIRALHADEVSDKPFPIDAEGNLSLPMVGKVAAAGLTMDQLEAAITKALSAYIKDPQVVVTVMQYHSEPVFLVGPFRAPGVYQLQGRRTLTELLSATGGLAPNASRRITLTRAADRGNIPLPGAVEDSGGKTSSVEINFNSGAGATAPMQDVTLQPYDVLKATLSEYVYVNGEVGHGGAFELNDRDSLSVTQVVSLAGGLTPAADSQKAHVLRTVLDTSKRAEIPLDVKSILAGNGSDFRLMPNDVLVVPRANSKRSTIGKTVLYLAVPAATLAVYLIRR